MAGAIYGEGFIELSPRVTDGALGSFGSALSSKMGPVASLAGGALVAGIGAVVAGGAAVIIGSLQEGIEREAALDLSAARLGLDPEQTAKIGEVAGLAYTNAFGESVIANQAVATDAMRRFGDATTEELQSLTEGALGLEEVFGTGYEQTLEAAQQLFVNGLAPSAEAALDIVSASLQGSTGDIEEVLSAINEYSTSFAKVGLDGENVISALSSEWATNQFAIDKVGDAVKELGIRAIDGSTASSEALEAIGLSTESVSEAFAAGGDVAEQMTKKIISSITSIEDPAEQAQIAVALMGTPFEDLGDSAVPILQDLIEGTDDFAGSTDRINDQAFDNVSSRISGAWRSIKEATIGAVNNSLLPAVASLSEWFADKLPAALEVLQRFFQPVLDFFAGLTGGLGSGEGALSKFGDVASRIGELVMVVFDALAVFWSDWGETIIGILSAAWSAVQTVFSAALDIITGILDVVIGILTGDWSRAWEGMKQILSGAMDAISGLLSAAWDAITALFSGALENIGGFIQDGFDRFVGWFRDLPGRILSAIGDIGSLLGDVGSDLIEGLWNGIKSMGSWLAGKLTGWVTDHIPGPIARALGISSPSKVGEMLGASVSEGLALGILSDIGMVERAGNALASAALPPLSSAQSNAINTATAMRRARGFDSPAMAGGAGIQIGDITVHNPTGEATEESLSRALSASLSPYVNVR